MDCPNKDKCRKCGQSGHFAHTCTQAWALVSLVGTGGATGDFPALPVPSGGGPLPAPTGPSAPASPQVDALPGAWGVSGSGELSSPSLVNAPGTSVGAEGGESLSGMPPDAPPLGVSGDLHVFASLPPSPLPGGQGASGSCASDPNPPADAERSFPSSSTPPVPPSGCS